MAREPTHQDVHANVPQEISELSFPLERDLVPSDLTGELIDGRFNVISLVGSGAMGQVYRAEHVHIRRPVAIKVIYPSLAAVPEFARRFEREAVAVGRLDHPNCVSILDFGRLADGGLFLAMQFLDGPTLSDLLRRGPMAPRRALHITRHVLCGLAHAHAAGIIHRDVKPANIIVVDYEGDPDFAKVLDFGVAKLADSLEDSFSTQITRVGQRFGTPHYMSPEQAVGGRVDARTDLYATSVMLYQMLTGRRPFEADDPLQLLGMKASKDPPSLAAAGSAGHHALLERLVSWGLAKRAADRYPTARDYIEAVDQCLAAIEESHTRRTTVLAGRQRLGRRWYAIGAAAVLAVVVVVALLAVGSSGNPSAAAKQLMAEGKPDQAVAYLEARRDDISDDATAQLQLGNSHAAIRGYSAAVIAYQRALQIDGSLGDDATLRSNLYIIADDYEHPDIAAGAASLLVDKLDDEQARQHVVEAASAHKRLDFRHRMRELAEGLGLGDRVDLVESLELDLRQLDQCPDRRSVVAKLRALGDPRAIAGLKKARARRSNDCLERDVDDAIRYLEGLPGQPEPEHTEPE